MTRQAFHDLDRARSLIALGACYALQRRAAAHEREMFIFRTLIAKRATFLSKAALPAMNLHPLPRWHKPQEEGADHAAGPRHRGGLHLQLPSRDGSGARARAFEAISQGCGLPARRCRMTAYYDFPSEHREHLRTRNSIESNFDVVLSRSNVCKRLRQAECATYLTCGLLVRRKERWRRFNGYALLAKVHQAIKQ